MQDTDFSPLFQKMLDNQCSPEEMEQLSAFLAKADNEAVVKQWIIEHYRKRADQPLPVADVALQKRLQARLQEILEAPVPAADARVKPMTWLLRIAAVLLFVTAGIYLFHYRAKTSLPPMAARQVQPGLPGTHQAVLVLANGHTLHLDSMGNQMLQQGNTVVQQKGGQLQYSVQKQAESIGYNSLVTPAGGRFQLVLPDGSRVWLNAASSIRYPTAFTDSRRMVEITGEAYFEITADAAHPFVVKKGALEVQVLGTHFNINAYEDEPDIRVTLLEGSVKVAGGRNDYLLLPGQQAQVAGNGWVSPVKEADAAQAIAWKNGYFSFKSADIRAVMRQLARWYNLQVSYTGAISERFYLEAGIYTNAADIFRILEATGGVHLKIEGQKIQVMP